MSKDPAAVGSTNNTLIEPTPLAFSDPHDYDVYFARGNGVAQMPGNKIYRQAIKSNQEKYQNAKGNKAKNQVALDVINVFRGLGGTFYQNQNQNDTRNQQWVEASFKETLRKVMQALRERRPSSSDTYGSTNTRRRRTRRSNRDSSTINISNSADDDSSALIDDDADNVTILRRKSTIGTFSGGIKNSSGNSNCLYHEVASFHRGPTAESLTNSAYHALSSIRDYVNDNNNEQGSVVSSQQTELCKNLEILSDNKEVVVAPSLHSLMHTSKSLEQKNTLLKNQIIDTSVQQAQPRIVADDADDADDVGHTLDDIVDKSALAQTRRFVEILETRESLPLKQDDDGYMSDDNLKP